MSLASDPLDGERRAMVPVFQTGALAPGSVAVVIPALNEETTVGEVVRDVRALHYRCVVVDDGSTDATGHIASKSGATVVRHLVPLGQGAALETGIQWALASGAEAIVTLDADGQHRVSDVPAMLAALTEQHADYALGSRFLGKAMNQPRSRRLLLRAAVQFTRLSTGMRVTDTHNGLRAMTRRGASAIGIRQNGMAHASEILGQIARSSLRWVEVPVTVEYTEHSLAKGQRSFGAVAILSDLFMGRLER